MASVTRSAGNLGAWTAYTPTWTGTTDPVIGNGTLTGAFAQIGKVVNFRIVITMGSTTTFGTGAYRFGVPVTAAASAVGIYTPVGDFMGQDNSTGFWYEATPVLALSTSLLVRYEVGNNVSTTFPFTWAVSDILAINGTYQAA